MCKGRIALAVVLLLGCYNDSEDRSDQRKSVKYEELSPNDKEMVSTILNQGLSRSVDGFLEEHGFDSPSEVALLTEIDALIPEGWSDKQSILVSYFSKESSDEAIRFDNNGIPPLVYSRVHCDQESPIAMITVIGGQDEQITKQYVGHMETDKWSWTLLEQK